MNPGQEYIFRRFDEILSDSKPALTKKEFKEKAYQMNEEIDLSERNLNRHINNYLFKLEEKGKMTKAKEVVESAVKKWRVLPPFKMNSNQHLYFNEPLQKDNWAKENCRGYNTFF